MNLEPLLAASRATDEFKNAVRQYSTEGKASLVRTSGTVASRAGPRFRSRSRLLVRWSRLQRRRKWSGYCPALPQPSTFYRSLPTSPHGAGPVANLTVPADPVVHKEVIRQYWETEPCGTRGVPSADRRRFFNQIERERYQWEPYIPPFARFPEGRGKTLLEIGVGAGTDFTNWVRN